MSEQHDYINPWAAKLEQVRIPELTESWRGMQILLDREMPVASSKHIRRWVLLVLLLLLLLGVCNCPRVLQMSKTGGDKTQQTENEIFHDSMISKPVYKKNNAGNKPLAGKSDLATRGPVSISSRDTVRSVSMNSVKTYPVDKNQNNDVPLVMLHKADSSEKHTVQRHKKKYQENNKSRTFIPRETQKSIATKEVPGNEIQTSDANLPEKDSLKSAKIDMVQKASPKLKAAQKKQADSSVNHPKKTKDADEYGKGWEVGIGLNQFFPVGQQEKSNYNSSGTTGSLLDYIPVPVIRYYFSKKWYVQAEAQFNSPQYTKNLLASQVNANVGVGSQDQNSVYIKKLFYFNLPVSIQYRLSRNLYAGAGLQFSALSNGVGLFEDKEIVTSGTDTLKSSKVQSFKSTPVYKELTTTEWRFLFDINYHWKPVTLGLRYNQAFTDFINIHISNTQVTQSRNSSLQLYLRYVIWKNRKKIVTGAK